MGENVYRLLSFFDFFKKIPLHCLFSVVSLEHRTKLNHGEKTMQLLTTTRPSDFPAYTLQYLRRLANLTARYCDRVDSEKDDYARERNYKFALRCIFRIQATLWDNAGKIDNREERERLSKISDALLGVWDILSDRRAFSVSAYIGIIAVLSIKCVDNYDLYKTSFDCILSQIKQYTK